ncbi:hypothetical protein NA57DRAFT_73115 [Rhizodiscina lignyota]|uniref:Uncharacterized protein n=1 Tax=Rhizodiscina lignyota TaxID=1504668 RepID=A0A9P4ILK9_9PEZI|nr:hypothetical protein NA57DRAFT_73115 [Rhizodiscina lignyota]
MVLLNFYGVEFCVPTFSVILLFVNFLIFPISTLSAPTPFDFETFIHDDLIPQKEGNTIPDELQCYSLPYGGIGFASHVITYYTVIMLGVGRKPLPPFSKLEHNYWDFFLALASVVITVPLAAFTIVRCLGRWQFVLLAVWKTTMSFTLAVVGLHRSVKLRKYKGMELEEEGGIFAWLVVYALGTIVGLTGLISLVIQTFTVNPKVRIITYVFGGIVGAAGLITLIAMYCSFRGDAEGFVTSVFGSMFAMVVAIACCMGMLAAFYSDWALGAIAKDDWAGAPSDDNKWLYWSYFAAKRLPLLSW